MSRDRRSAHSSSVHWPTRQQDHRGVSEQIAALVAPVAADVDEQGEQLEELEAAIAGGVFMASADVDLHHGYSGVALLEGTFTVDQVGAPVIVTESGDAGDELEGIALFVGSVLDERRLKLRWMKSSPAPRRVRVNFIVGVRS